MRKITLFQFGLWAVLTTLFVQPCAADDITLDITLNPDGGDNMYVGAKVGKEYSFTYDWGKLDGVMDPMKPGHTFTGWNYPINLVLRAQTPLKQLMLANIVKNDDKTDNDASYDGRYIDIRGGLTITTTGESWSDCTGNGGVKFQQSTGKDQYYHVLSRDYMYKDSITVTFWAHMEDWSKYVVQRYDESLDAMRMVSCANAAGWTMGEKTTKKINNKEVHVVTFAIYDEGAGYKHLEFDLEWQNLDAGWHMFTLVFNGTKAYGYIDGGTKGKAETTDFTGNIKYDDDNYIIVGAEAGLGLVRQEDEEESKHVGQFAIVQPQCYDFIGHIKNLSIMHEALTKEEVETLYGLQNAANQTENEKKYPNHLTSSTPTQPADDYTYNNITATWKALAESTVTCLSTDEQFSNRTNSSIAKKGKGGINGVSSTVETPLANDNDESKYGLYKDHDVFHYWEGTGVDYLSNFQRHLAYDPTTEKKGDVLFTGDVKDGVTSELTFDGKKDYYAVLNPVATPTSGWTDCFTINVWASMENWNNLQQADRLWSCTNTGGCDVYADFTSSTKTLYFDIYDNGKYRNAKATIEASELGANTYHMFTYVYNSKYVWGYFDGKLVASYGPLVSPKVVGNLNYIMLGAEPDGLNGNNTINIKSESYFKGKMKNFAMIHAVLSPSQVKDLYDAQKEESPHLFYYHPAENKELQANWTLLPLLAATNNGSKIVGGNEFKHDLQIQGNGKEATTLTPTAGKIDGDKQTAADDEKVLFTYEPQAGKSTALTLSASRSTDQKAVTWVNFQPEETTAAVSESTELTEKDIEENSYVLVQRDLTLTGKHTLQDVYVNAGSKLTLENSEEKPITANSVTIRTAGDNAETALVMPANSSLRGVKTVSLTKTIPSEERYYFFSLPFDCKVEDMYFVGKDTKPVRGTDYLIISYDGQARVYNQGYSTSWDYEAENAILKAGKGYGITATAGAEVVFPMTVPTGASGSTGTAGEDAIEDLAAYDNKVKEVAVVAWGLENDETTGNKKEETVHESNYGWNLVGNPYFAAYGMKELDNSGGILKTGHKNGKLVTEGYWVEDGNYYEDDGKSVYITYSEDGGMTYKQALFGNKFVLNPFSAYFVQVAQTGNLTYKLAGKNPSQQQQSIRSRKAAAVSTTKYINLNLTGKAQTDETTLVVGEKFTTQYEVGADLQKWLADDASALQVYLLDASCMYRFMALNKETVQKTDIPVGVCLPAAGEYTFSLTEEDKEKVEAVYLTDKETGTTMDLKDTDYPFTVSSATKSDKRFVISAVVNTDVATVLSDTKADPMKARKVWENGTIYIIRNGEVYTTDGRRVR